MDLIEWNMKALARCKENDRVMVAFPINSASCSKFGCRLNGLCSQWPNPLRNQDRCPTGMETRYWDPRDKREKAHKIIDLTMDTLTEVAKGNVG